MIQSRVLGLVRTKMGAQDAYKVSLGRTLNGWKAKEISYEAQLVLT
jgi:hypothetical protein